MRSFLVRLMKVLWVLSTIVTVASFIGAFTTGEMVNIAAVALVAFLWFVALIVLQYLVFGKLDPLSAFNGSLLEKRYPR